MKLSPPTNLTFWIALIVGVLGILGNLTSIPFASEYSFLLLVVGFVLLVLGVLFKRM
ncbi:MAG: hypothetical protein JW704_08120 [Anaerolineaceae bacterium]|nr:hypothetical protein [Anaerolineaceae bacterium]